MELLHDGGSNFLLVELRPGMGRFMHATDTLDYLVVLTGEVVLELETGEVLLKPGDFVVDRRRQARMAQRRARSRDDGERHTSCAPGGRGQDRMTSQN